MKNIAIYIPTRIYGGAERQMALLACLAADHGYMVSVIDSSVGVVAKILQNRSDIKILYKQKSKKLKIKDSIVITQASYAFCLNSFLDLENCQVNFWFMHSLNLPHMNVHNRLPKYLKIFSSLIKNIYRKRLVSHASSFFFMGNDIKESIETFYDVRMKENFTGMLSEKRAVEVLSDVSNNKNSLCWLGRLDKSSKRIILKKILYDFSISEFFKKNYVFHIIGDGESQEELALYVKKLNINKNVFFHGHVEYEILPEIISLSNILFAHGTSVYEGVYCGVPVSLIDFYSNDEDIKQMKYEFYHEHDGSGFGDLITSRNDPIISKGQDFNSLLKKSISDREIITKLQEEKLRKFIDRSEKKCLRLFEASDKRKETPKRIFLDELFFKLRESVLRKKN
tara:strand:- start:21 stop:1208 length:1188 start_codon:yes stop_codon:yes gene_type:complete